MTTYLPGYRLTVYERRSDQSDPTEPDILSPIAGAVHSDPFKVASLQGISGFQPYLGTITGRRGKIDPRTKKVTTGQLSVTLLDARTGTSNLERWVTAFLGDTQGRNQLLGNKVYIEESLDGGSTWSPFFVGRIEATSLQDPLWYALTLRDMADDLDADAFVGHPNSAVTYAAATCLLPLGLTADYGNQVAADPLTGTWGTVNVQIDSFRTIQLDAASRSRLDNMVTAALFRTGVALQEIQGVTAANADPTIRLRFTSTSPSLTNKEVFPGILYFKQRPDRTGYVTEVWVAAVGSDDPNYVATDTTTIPDGTTCSFTVRHVVFNTLGMVDEEPDSGTPLYLDEQNLMQVWKDLLDGYFGLQWGAGSTPPTGKAVGDPLRSIPYDASGGSAFDQITNATNRDPVPSVRFRITKPTTIRQFIEQTSQFAGLSYRLQPALNGSVPECRFVPVDMRLPTAAAIASIPTITDADIDTSSLPTRDDSREDAITNMQVNWYTDVPVDPTEVTDLTKVKGSTVMVPNVPLSLMDEVLNTEVFRDPNLALNLGEQALTIDAIGIRGSPDITDLVQGIQVDVHAQRQATHVFEFYRSQFSSGPATITFRCRRTANTSTLWPGDWVYLDVDVLPDTATNVRGGVLLVQVLERNEVGPVLEFGGIYAGAGVVCGVPTIGTPIKKVDAPSHALQVSVTLNAAGEPVELRTNVQATSYGTTPPADTDAGWVPAGRVTVSATTGVSGLQSGKRIFIQGRSVPKTTGSADSPKLPSAWTSPSGTKYVDLDAITAPSGVTVSPGTILTTSTVTVSWTNGSAYRPVEVSLWNSSGTTLQEVVGLFVPGSVGPVTLNEFLVSSTTYTVKVRHLDGLGGASNYGSTTFTTPSGFAGPTLTAPTLTILAGTV